MDDPRAFYTVPEAAALLRCSARTIYRYIRDGTLEGKKGPVQMLIPGPSLQAFIDSFPDVEVS
jgi:excisionase family DNA binding protein